MTPQPRTYTIDWSFFPPLLKKARELGGKPPSGALQKKLIAEFQRGTGMSLRDPRKLRMMAVAGTEALWLIQELPSARCITSCLNLNRDEQSLLLGPILAMWSKWYLLFSTLVPPSVIKGGTMTQTFSLGPIDLDAFNWRQLRPTPAQSAFGADWRAGRLDGATAEDVRRFEQRLTSLRSAHKWDDPLYNYCLGTGGLLLIAAVGMGPTRGLDPKKLTGFESIAAVLWHHQLEPKYR
jgi:hypothetical protein